VNVSLIAMAGPTRAAAHSSAQHTLHLSKSTLHGACVTSSCTFSFGDPSYGSAENNLLMSLQRIPSLLMKVQIIAGTVAAFPSIAHFRDEAYRSKDV
jgi:hypothetical protein